MDSTSVTLRISGLTDDEAIELEEAVGRDAVRLEREPIPEGTFGDLGLVTGAVLISAVALKGLVAYLMLRHRGKSFEEKVEVETKKGRFVRTVTWRDTSGEPVDVALAAALSDVPGLDAGALLGQTK